MARTAARVQPDLFSDLSPRPGVTSPRAAVSVRSGAFIDNMKLPVHRWFRYSAGFSADWVRHVIQTEGGAGLRVLDPFAGSGTALLAAQSVGAEALGLEAHPFVSKIARVKLSWPQVDPIALHDAGQSLLSQAKAAARRPARPGPALLDKCYPPEILADLQALRDTWERVPPQGVLRDVLWLALTAILRECSPVGTAQWQYVLPNKSKAAARSPFTAFADRVRLFCDDLAHARAQWGGQAGIETADARTAIVSQGAFDLVVTSPPYPNNYDYADATRLEMSFWGDDQGWGDLHRVVRSGLICSCSQHSAADRLHLDAVLAEPVLAPILDELEPVCRELDRVRHDKGGKKTYHTMIAAYFLGLAQTWHNLRPAMKPGSRLHFVIGDSAPYGVYVPCELWLGRLALAAGFHDFAFEKLRDRNTKWKNRKHDVPLKEGVLTVRG